MPEYEFFRNSLSAEQYVNDYCLSLEVSCYAAEFLSRKRSSLSDEDRRFIYDTEWLLTEKFPDCEFIADCFAESFENWHSVLRNQSQGQDDLTERLFDLSDRFPDNGNISRRTASSLCEIWIYSKRKNAEKYLPWLENYRNRYPEDRPFTDEPILSLWYRNLPSLAEKKDFKTIRRITGDLSGMKRNQLWNSTNPEDLRILYLCELIHSPDSSDWNYALRNLEKLSSCSPDDNDLLVRYAEALALPPVSATPRQMSEAANRLEEFLAKKPMDETEKVSSNIYWDRYKRKTSSSASAAALIRLLKKMAEKGIVPRSSVMKRVKTLYEKYQRWNNVAYPSDEIFATWECWQNQEEFDDYAEILKMKIDHDKKNYDPHVAECLLSLLSSDKVLADPDMLSDALEKMEHLPVQFMKTLAYKQKMGKMKLQNVLLGDLKQLRLATRELREFAEDFPEDQILMENYLLCLVKGTFYSDRKGIRLIMGKFRAKYKKFPQSSLILASLVFSLVNLSRLQSAEEIPVSVQEAASLYEENPQSRECLWALGMILCNEHLKNKREALTDQLKGLLEKNRNDASFLRFLLAYLERMQNKSTKEERKALIASLMEKISSFNQNMNAPVSVDGWDQFFGLEIR